MKKDELVSVGDDDAKTLRNAELGITLEPADAKELFASLG